jgi:hypothetical protein
MVGRDSGDDTSESCGNGGGEVMIREHGSTLTSAASSVAVTRHVTTANATPDFSRENNKIL